MRLLIKYAIVGLILLENGNEQWPYFECRCNNGNNDNNDNIRAGVISDAAVELKQVYQEEWPYYKPYVSC